MKSVLLLASLSSFSFFSATAQINRGSVLLGGGVSATSAKISQSGFTQTQRYLTIAPSIGVAVRTNTVVGLNLQFGGNRDNMPVSNARSTTYGAGVFYRRYLPLGKNFYLAGEADLSYSRQRRTTVMATPSGDILRDASDNIGLGFTPSITYAVGKRFHLQAAVNQLFGAYYQKSTSRMDSNPASELSTRSFGLHANASSFAPLSLGFRIVLGK
jgi:hypothetical protein